MISKLSEADASQRVLEVLHSLFRNCKKEFLVLCQLSVKDHPTFTLIKITDGEGKCIIVEVIFFVTCNLNYPTDEVAQVLRQAQIVIEDTKLNDVIFVLTNSLDWSFGMVKKKEDKIEVAWTTYINISADQEELILKVYQLFLKTFNCII